MKSFLCIFLIFVVTGCVSTYKLKNDINKSSILTVKHMQDKITSVTTVAAYNNIMCKVTDGYGKVARTGKALLLSKSATIYIDANERLYLLVVGGDSTFNVSHFCGNLTSFIPVKGEKYTLYQEHRSDVSSKSFILNKNNGKEANGFTIHTIDNTCKAWRDDFVNRQPIKIGQ